MRDVSDYDTNPSRNRPARDPGGMVCERCDEIFIGADWHSYCGICVEKVIAEETARRAAVTTGDRTNG